LKTLQRQRSRVGDAAAAIPETQSAIKARRQQLEDKRRERDRLTLRAPREGTVLPPPWNSRTEEPEGILPGWTGIPLDRRNLGAHLEQGTLFCKIGDRTQFEALLMVDQADIGLVEKDQRVELKLDAMPHEVLRGRIEEISQREVQVASRRLSGKGGGELATTTTASGIEKPASPTYQARVPLDDTEGLLRVGLRGQAKIYMQFNQWQSLGSRVWRFLKRTFHFRL